ncbi:RloB domain-containing protein [Candidatus Peregrinibacteria bacterium]|nr:RloB domain-containing protein [Candidatus Peregrinibacteria bacterium]
MKKTRMKPRIYILCNGELAEPQYFQDFKNHLKAHNILVRYRKEFLKKAPWSFIEAAIKFKEEEQQKGKFSEDDNDQIWLVFDVDNYWSDNENKFRDALKLAEENGLNVAWSNECFEFWFLCHFGFYNSAIPRTDYHKKLAKKFKDEDLGKYEKNMKGIFEPLIPLQSTAIANAKRLYRRGAVGNNPSTAVHLLVEELGRIFGAF